MDADILQMLKAILSEAGIQNYEPEVLTHLSDYIDGFIDEIMEKSKDYMKHANRSTLDVSDVKLALDEKRKTESKCKPAWNELIKLAKEHNKTNLPPAKEKIAIAIPSNALNSTNYRMKGLTPPQFSYQIPGYSAALSELARNPAGVNAIIRKLAGNHHHHHHPQQHIIFKQQIPIRKEAQVPTDDHSLKKRKTI